MHHSNYISGAAVLALLAGGSAADAERIKVPRDYPTIQAAIDAASPGDAVVVAPGEWDGPIRISTNIRVRSARGADRTTIRASSGGPVVILEAAGGEGGTLAGFTISGGTGLNGGGLFLSGDVAVVDCTVTGNTAENGGGAFLTGTPFLSAVRFFGNSAGRGGGVFVAPGGQPLLDNCEFVGNDADLGGGVYLSPHGITETQSVIASASFDLNSADEGGGLYAAMCEFEVEDTTFTENTATGSGGGARLAETGACTFATSEFSDNTADQSGGAACITGGSDLLVTDCEVAENGAGTVGGGLETDAASLLAVALSVLWGNSPEDIAGDWQDFGDNSFARPPACDADLALPYGVLDVNDIMAWVPLFLNSDPSVDLAEPFGMFDLADIVAFVNLYHSGCE